MAFQVLTSTIITNAIGANDYAVFTEVSTAMLEQAEDVAIGEIKSRLGHRFNVVASLTANPMDSMLKRILLDLTLFEAYKVLAPQNIPDIRVKCSDMARADLKAWGNGSTYCPLPLIVDEKKGRGRIAFGAISTNELPSGLKTNY
jgi:hypothetical protein